jgi:secreted Zn-dependent insulinase-like peptidase
VQSSSKDADYLEHRINNFLDGFRKKDTPFTEESVESMKLGIIGLVKQKNTNLGMECDQNVL